MAVELDKSQPTVHVTNLKFTYPGIDGHPPPGAKPLIDEFSLSLFAGQRCLLVGSNGAGLFLHSYLWAHHDFLFIHLIMLRFLQKIDSWFCIVWWAFRENDYPENHRREAHGGPRNG